MFYQSKLNKILKEKNVKALKECIQNDKITDEMYKMMFVSDYRNPPKNQYMFDCLRYYHNDAIDNRDTIKIFNILLKNVPIHYLSGNAHFFCDDIRPQDLQRVINAGLLEFISYPLVQFTLLYYPSTLADMLLKAISKSGRNDVVVEKEFIEEVRKYREKQNIIDFIRNHLFLMEETEETIKKYCVKTKNGDYIVMPYQFRKKVSKEIIEEFKNLSMEFV
jgi:hypothetical protein